MNIVFEFIKYQLIAKGRHGIHSPFVYKLVDEILNQKVPNSVKLQQNELFRNLKKTKTKINFQEFGAGSKKMDRQRIVSDVFRQSATRGKYAKLIYLLSKNFEHKEILELGTSLGVGTLHLHWGNPSAKITTLEACPNTFAFARKNLQSQCYPNGPINIENTLFKEFIETSKTNYDLIFIDGHHNGTALLEYMEALDKNSNERTIFIVDDIRWSKDMLMAWNQLIQNEKYQLSIDFFKMGILMKRPTQMKEHFTLKL
jgi:predicted O-methyltransferase YrrM